MTTISSERLGALWMDMGCVIVVIVQSRTNPPAGLWLTCNVTIDKYTDTVLIEYRVHQHKYWVDGWDLQNRIQTSWKRKQSEGSLTARTLHCNTFRGIQMIYMRESLEIIIIIYFLCSNYTWFLRMYLIKFGRLGEPFSPVDNSAKKGEKNLKELRK